MKNTSSVLILLGLAMLAASYSTVHAQDATKSVLDGVYTDAQAKRGEAVYAATCTVCHGAKQEGTLSGPTLTGTDFTSDWKGMSLAALLTKIKNDMPSNDPGTLTPEQAADLVSFLLSVNKYPAGQTELPTDVAAVRPVRMVEPPK